MFQTPVLLATSKIGAQLRKQTVPTKTATCAIRTRRTNAAICATEFTVQTPRVTLNRYIDSNRFDIMFLYFTIQSNMLPV